MVTKDLKKQEAVVEDDHGEIFFSWRFSEFPKYERKRSWYIWGSSIVFVLLIFSFWTANLMFGLVTLMIAMTVVLFHRNNGEIQFEIAEDGISLNKRFYSYDSLKNFYVIYEPPEVKALYFEPKSNFQPRIPIYLEDQDPIKIREILLQYLEEDLDRDDEPLSDQISRFFKL